MASGNLSPRQKMINMMYLVLMAMLALNVSKDVLKAFGSINETTDRIVKTTVLKNKLLYNDLKIKSTNNPKRYQKLYNFSIELAVHSNNFVQLLETYKRDMIELSGAVDSDTGKLNYSYMDGDEGSEYLFTLGENNKSRELVKAMDDYLAYLLKSVDNKNLKEQIKQIFNTKNVIDKDGIYIPWVKHKFEHYPLAAQITFLSQIQADVRNSEGDVLQSLLVGELSGQMQVNDIRALVVPESTTVIKNGKFKANVVLVAYDTTLLPKVYLHEYNSLGRRIGTKEKEIKVKNGKGIVEIPANRLGEYHWGGVVKLKNELGEIKEYPFKNNIFMVNDAVAVVSADKMNVLYRGVENPISVSAPGIPSKDLIVKAYGIKKIRSASYSLNVTNFRGKILSINVSARISGKVRNLVTKRYRVKDIPPPVGTVRGETDAKMPINNLKISTIGAELKNFEFDLDLLVTSFSVKVSGKPTILVKGNKFNERAKRVISQASIGDVVIISNIKVKIPGNNRYKVANVAPVLVTINGK